MTHPLRTFTIGTVIALIFVIACAYTVKANPSYFIRSSNLATTFSIATTSVAFLTTAAPTSTVPFDLGVFGPQGADSVALTTQFIGSTTASTLNWYLEYAQGGNGLDCVNAPNSCDWFADRVNVAATTTPQVSLSVPTTYTLNSLGGRAGGQVGIASTTRTITLAVTPTRYIRAVYFLAPGSVLGSVWGEFIAKRQNP